MLVTTVVEQRRWLRGGGGGGAAAVAITMYLKCICNVLWVGALKYEKRIPNLILKQSKGLAILTAVKVGVGISYSIGTRVVVARREDGSWSPPSALSSFGVGWGAQAGGEFTDFIRQRRRWR